MVSIPVYVGYDPRESAAYHIFCNSVIARSTKLVNFIPLHRPMLDNFDGQRDGTNAFIFSRFLVPQLQDFDGWAIFADGDMVCADDIDRLWQLRNDKYAVMVAKHDYQTIADRKYIGTKLENSNVNYPRKNWSSVILWNCGHPSNRLLTRSFLDETDGRTLHRFAWLKDEEIGEIPLHWNWLVGEYEPRPAALYHYTLGVPAMPHYKDLQAAPFHDELRATLNVAGIDPVGIVERAKAYA